MTWSNHNRASSQTAMHDLIVVIILKRAESEYLSTFLSLFLLFFASLPGYHCQKPQKYAGKQIYATHRRLNINAA